MTQIRKQLAVITALALGATVVGCSEPAITTSAPKPQVPPESDQPAHVLMDVAPDQEDAFLFHNRLATATVPVELKPALQKGALAKNVRKFPYPYNAMLAIASDIDDTTPEEFAEYHRFLNTTENTPQGPGVGLDVGDTFWMYMANDTPNVTDKAGHQLEGVMTYFDWIDPTKKRYADQIVHYWKAGWIDSMHTFGDFSRKNTIKFTRALAKAAWDEMQRQGINCEVWLNHGNEANVDAFGAYNPHLFSRYQAGDNPQSPYYHTDMTIKNGIHFVWDSVGESQFGQDQPTFEIKLRDGQKVWGFHRYTNEVTADGKKDWTWVPREIHRQITKERLDQLVAKKQYAVLGQHLGGYNIGFPFDEKGVATLRMLANYQDQGKVLVARTSRLLKYSVDSRGVSYAYAEKDGEGWLNITGVNDPLFGPQPLTIDTLRGVTFYLPKPEKTHLLINMNPVDPKEYQVNPADETGKPSLGIRWFPRDVEDHTYAENPDARM